MFSIDGVCGDLSFSFHPHPFLMQTPNGKGVDSNANSVNATNDARHALDVGAPLTQRQAGLLYVATDSSAYQCGEGCLAQH